MDFPLLTEKVEFRNQTFLVRELTAEEFSTWAKAVREDPDRKLLEAARFGTLEPKLPTDEAALRALPAALVIKLAEAVLRISEATEGPKETAPTETSTG